MERFIACFLALTLLLTGCSTSPKEEAQGSSSDGGTSAPVEGSAPENSLMMEYTNLNSEASCQQVDTILEAAGVSEQRRQVFFDHVKQFNGSVDAAPLLGAFQTANILAPGYDPYDYQDQWMESHPDFNGYNCRITAFGLFGDNVSTAAEGEIRDNELFMDLESLEEDPSGLMGADLDSFRRVFSTVPTDNTTDIAVHAANIQADWENRGISIEESDTLRLITVWFHNQWSEEENELFVGHVGVLADTADGLYFVEKVAFQEPYQVVKLESREMLNTYLMGKYDVSWGQDTASPFVMENTTLLTDLIA